MDERQDSKSGALREHGALHARPGQVHDPLFQHSEFFDPRDLVLVKVRDASPCASGGAVGHGRGQVFWLLAGGVLPGDGAFQKEGLPACCPAAAVPSRPASSPRRSWKFVDRQRAADGSLRAPELARMIQEHVGVSAHPRSIERALARRSKKGATLRAVVATDAPGDSWTARCRRSPPHGIGQGMVCRQLLGLTLFMRQGLAAWMRAWPRQVGDDPPLPKPALTQRPLGSVVHISLRATGYGPGEHGPSQQDRRSSHDSAAAIHIRRCGPTISSGMPTCISPVHLGSRSSTTPRAPSGSTPSNSGR